MIAENVDNHDVLLYQQFERLYALQNPPPARPVAVTRKAERAIFFLLVVVLVCAGVVSASRTIREFGGGVVGVAAFFMVEVFAVTGAFFYTLRGAETAHNPVKLAKRGVWAVVLVAVAGNLHNVLAQTQDIQKSAVSFVSNVTDVGFVLPSWLNVSILASIAVIAPVVLFVVGEILAIEVKAARGYAARVEREYQEQLQRWRDELNRAWQANKGAYRRRYAVVSEQRAGGQAAGSAKKAITRKSGDAIVAYLQQNPDDRSLSVRALTEKLRASGLSVSKSTVARVLQQIVN